MLSFDNRFLPSLTAFLYITCLFTFKKSNSYYFKRSGLVKNDEDDGISKRHIPSESEECQYGLKPMTEDEWLFYMSGLIARVKNALMEAEMTLHDVEKDITVPDFVDTIHIYELDDVFRFTEDPPKKKIEMMYSILKAFVTLKSLWKVSMLTRDESVSEFELSNHFIHHSPIKSRDKPYNLIDNNNNNNTIPVNDRNNSNAKTDKVNAVNSKGVKKIMRYDKTKVRRSTSFFLHQTFMNLAYLICYIKSSLVASDKMVNADLPSNLMKYAYIEERSQSSLRDTLLMKKYISLLKFIMREMVVKKQTLT